MRLAAVVLAALLLAPAALAHGGRDPLAFVKSGRLWVYDPDADVTRALAGARVAHDVAVSPDGTRIAYTARGGGIRVVGADGRGDATVPGTAGGTNPRWTSEEALTFFRVEGGVTRLRSTELAGAGARELLRGKLSGGAFPVGSSELVARTRRYGCGADLELAGKPLARTTAIDETALDYQADLGVLVLRRPCSGRWAQIVRQQLGAGWRPLVRVDARSRTDAAFSPHGTELAYLGRGGELRLRRFFDGGERVITRGATALDW